MSYPVKIHESLDPTWPKFGLQMPDRQMQWVESKQVAINIAKRAGYRLVQMQIIPCLKPSEEGGAK